MGSSCCWTCAVTTGTGEAAAGAEAGWSAGLRWMRLCAQCRRRVAPVRTETSPPSQRGPGRCRHGHRWRIWVRSKKRRGGHNAERGGKRLGRGRLRAAVVAMAMGVLSGMTARADLARHFSFAYDQPHSTGYGVAADLFNSKLIEMSHGSMAVDRFPANSWGRSPRCWNRSVPATSTS